MIHAAILPRAGNATKKQKLHCEREKKLQRVPTALGHIRTTLTKFVFPGQISRQIFVSTKFLIWKLPSHLQLTKLTNVNHASLWRESLTSLQNIFSRLEKMIPPILNISHIGNNPKSTTFITCGILLEFSYMQVLRQQRRNARRRRFRNHPYWTLPLRWSRGLTSIFTGETFPKIYSTVR